jgi:hypothetical protein
VIKLQFVLSPGWTAQLTAWWGMGYNGWSHVDAVMPTGWLLGARDDVIKAPDGLAYKAGVELRPPDYEKWIRRTVVTLKVSQVMADKWQEWLLDQRDRPYDSDAIWGFILGRKQHAKGHWICSALQTGALRQIGKLFKLPYEPSQVTPDTLFFAVTAGLGGSVES